MKNDREVVPVSLPQGLVKEIDTLVEKGVFSSRSDAIRFGTRLVVAIEKRLHERSADYTFIDALEGFGRGRHVSRH